MILLTIVLLLIAIIAAVLLTIAGSVLVIFIDPIVFLLVIFATCKLIGYLKRKFQR